MNFGKAISFGSFALPFVFAFACGPAKPTTVTPATIGSASADAGASHASSLPSGLPPMAPMPPPGVKGSLKVDLRATDATCDLAEVGSDLRAKLTSAIACDKGLHAQGAIAEGSAGEGDPATESTFHAEKGHCYRVYITHDLPSVVVVLKDSVGARIAESPAAATPEHARACFTDSDAVTISVAGGRGKGRYALQVVSD